MTDQTARMDEEALSPRAAQDRLAQAFAAEGATHTENGDGDASAHSSNIAMLDEDADVPRPENPFAREAAQAVAMRRIEALLFASPAPISETALAERVPGVDLAAVLAKLEAHYCHRGVVLRQVDKKWQFVTAPDCADVLVEQREQAKKLSRAALETLAIVAYHQPCTRADIEEVRGVAVAKGSLDQLMELGWVRLRGRRDAPGRPVLYGTTPAFLEHFGLADLTHLPGMSDLKAAGLLEARLPPGFQVPVPRGEDDDGAHDEASLSDADFTTDFHDDEAFVSPGDAPALAADSLDEAGAFPEPDDEPF